MGTPKLTPAQLDDLAYIRHCARLAYLPYVKRMGREPAPMVADFDACLEAGHLEIIALAAEPIGYVVSYAHTDYLFVENIALHPDHHNRGYASVIFSLLEQRCRAQGLDAIELYTNAKMTENLPIYEQLGFEITDRRMEDGFDRIYFRKAVFTQANKTI